MINLKRINKYYRNAKFSFQALKNLDLVIKTGEFVMIMGPSGSGKSTLLQIIGLLDQDFEGEYFLEGTDIKTMSDDELSILRNQKIGFVFQNFKLIQNLTVAENLALPMTYHNLTYETQRVRIESLLSEFQLLDKLTSYPSDLSGGQQQRIAIIRALINEPKLIVADEPTGALDSQCASEIMAIFHSLHQKGLTIVMITHDQQLAKRATRIINIFDGKLGEE
ncbi:MAG: ABC transporter ATP-binding protein [Culicoidibacterales bacterium]